MNILTKLLAFFIVMAIACSVDSSKKENIKVITDFLSAYPINIDTVNSVLVISEKGCPKCNKSFALFAKKFISAKNSITIVSSKGLIIDVSSFENYQGVYFDYNSDFLKTKISDGSCAIFIDKGRIDTIVQIKAETFEKSIDYLSDRL